MAKMQTRIETLQVITLLALLVQILAQKAVAQRTIGDYESQEAVRAQADTLCRMPTC